MNSQRILFLHLSSKAVAMDHLVELLEDVERDRFEPVVLVATGGPVSDAFRRIGVEIHFRPLCACFVGACYRTNWVGLLIRPGVILVLVKYCWFVRQFINDQRIAAVCTHSTKSGVLGRIAALLAGAPLVRSASLRRFPDPRFKCDKPQQRCE